MQNRNIAVVTAQMFPSGLASNNRILSYSKGLVALGTSVEVLTLATSDKSVGSIEGVGYKNLGSRRVNNRLAGTAIGFLKLSKALFRGKYSHLILVSNNAALIVWLFLICRMSRIKFLQEKSEFPFVLNYKGKLKELFAKLYVNNIYRLFDGMIIMTEPLLEYFKDKIKTKCQLLLMPMTVDVSRFDNIRETDQYSNCITYCGYMGGNKDGVRNLIEAFSFIQEEFPEINLLLLGTAKESELEEIKEYADRVAPLRVIFGGQISREDIPYFLKNSKILALARPDSLQSLGGFPTKLGEYLSTKKPTVVTAVGDIPRFLKNRENAFVIPPDDNVLFAEELRYILRHYPEALRVAEKGYHLTLEVFNYKQQAVRLDEFLKKV